jgi:hypothetical protein
MSFHASWVQSPTVLGRRENHFGSAESMVSIGTRSNNWHIHFPAGGTKKVLFLTHGVSAVHKHVIILLCVI